MKDIIATYKPCPTYVLKIIEAAARYQLSVGVKGWHWDNAESRG